MNNDLFNGLVIFMVFWGIVLVILLLILLIKIPKWKKKGVLRRLLLSVALGFAGIILFLSTWIFTDILTPEGYLYMTLPSPDNSLEMNVYSYSGFVDKKTMRVEVVNKQTGDEDTVYYDIPKYGGLVQWLDESTILVDNRRISVGKDT